MILNWQTELSILTVMMRLIAESTALQSRSFCSSSALPKLVEERSHVMVCLSNGGCGLALS